MHGIFSIIGRARARAAPPKSTPVSLKSFFFGRDWAGSASDWKCPEEALFSRMNVYLCVCVCNRRKLLISRAPTKAKSQEPAYSQGLNQNKIDRQRSRSRESGRQTVRRLWWMVFGVETGREVWG